MRSLLSLWGIACESALPFNVAGCELRKRRGVLVVLMGS